MATFSFSHNFFCKYELKLTTCLYLKIQSLRVTVLKFCTKRAIFHLTSTPFSCIYRYVYKQYYLLTPIFYEDNMFQIFSITQISMVEFLSYNQMDKTVFKIQKKIMHTKEMIILGYASLKIIWQSEYFYGKTVSISRRIAFILSKPVLSY